eukprot:15160224-Alexandrium_andersonii.AAC.1
MDEALSSFLNASPRHGHEFQRPPRDSVLAERLITLWGWGHLSASQVQWIASGAVADKVEHPEVVALSKLGTSGEYQGNVRRDLLRTYASSVAMPPPS